MWKIVLLVSLVPVIAGVLLRKWCCDRVLKKMEHGVTNQTGQRLAAHLLLNQKLDDEIEIVDKKKTRLIIGPPVKIQLSSGDQKGKDILTLGRVANVVGRSLIAHEHAQLIGWREWAVRFGWAFPAFTALVVVFAIAVAKLTVMMGITVVVGALGLSSVFLLATTMVELEASKRASRLIERTGALPRSADGEEVAKCCRALAWERVVPGVLRFVTGKTQ